MDCVIAVDGGCVIPDKPDCPKGNLFIQEGLKCLPVCVSSMDVTSHCGYLINAFDDELEGLYKGSECPFEDKTFYHSGTCQAEKPSTCDSAENCGSGASCLMTRYKEC